MQEIIIAPSFRKGNNTNKKAQLKKKLVIKNPKFIFYKKTGVW
jgi:hypothetical protein